MRSLRDPRAVRRLGMAVTLSVLSGVTTAVLSAQVAGAATQTVTNCNDSGPGSLRQAVASAKSAGRITFGVSCWSITLTSGALSVSRSVEIMGPGSGILAVSGDDASTVFDIGRRATVVISGLTLDDGFSIDAGGIVNAGRVSIDNSAVLDNHATLGGAGIYNDAGGVVTVSHSTVSGNQLSSGEGSGIFNAGTLTVSDSTVSANTVSSGAGGGIFNAGTLTVSDSTVSANTVSSGAGGGIFNAGTLTVSDSTVSANTVSSGAGGGIFNAGTLSATGSTMSDNSSPVGDGGAVDNAGTLSVTSATLSDNSAFAGGGVYNAATAVVTGDTVSGNSAFFGGALYSTSKVTVTSSTLSDNTAVGANDSAGGGLFTTATAAVSSSTLSGNIALGGSLAYGGGIDNGGTMTVSNSTLSGNTAAASSGGSGGGIDNTGTVTITNSTLVGNSAAGGSGGSGASGGGIDNGGTTDVQATIVAESPSGGGCNAPVTDHGYNIDDDGTCFTAATSGSDSTRLDASLGALADNGGPTETIAVSPTSPVVDQVPGTDCPATDQRGALRAAPCDVGAYDTNGNPVVASVEPTSGKVGKQVIIEGRNLSGATQVSFNGVRAALSADTPTEIVTSVPAGATSGLIGVTTWVGGSVTSTEVFTVTGSTAGRRGRRAPMASRGRV